MFLRYYTLVFLEICLNYNVLVTLLFTTISYVPIMFTLLTFKINSIKYETKITNLEARKTSNNNSVSPNNLYEGSESRYNNYFDIQNLLKDLDQIFFIDMKIVKFFK